MRIRTRTQNFDLHVPTSTIAKGLATALLVWAGLRLWPELVLLLVSVILAIALEPVVDRLSAGRLSRGVSVILVALVLLVLAGLFVAFLVPPLVDQVGGFIGKLPELRHDIRNGISHDANMREWVDNALHLPSDSARSTAEQLLAWGQATISGVMSTFLVFIVTLYLILDGRRLYAWLLAYVPVQHRAKMAATVPEVCGVIRGYVRGQVITSVLFGAFAAAVLVILRVPAVIPLALLAALCDVIPVIGIIVATIPAALLGLAVSPLTAAAVAIAYVVYHLFEAYFIVPRVYGSSLRMSTLTVLLALIIGGSLQGILGAALILPIVAAYPTIERIWLKPYLGRQVIAEHNALADAMESGDDQAIEQVIRAEKQAADRPSQSGGE
jgi:predicted PurR-regulated permease PerM